MHVDVVGDALRIQVDQSVAAQSVKDLLSRQLFLPDGFVRTLFNAGRIRIGPASGAPDQFLRAGQAVWLRGGVEEAEPVAADWASMALDVLYEDDHVLIVNKPAGVLVYPGTTDDTSTLLQRVAAYYTVTGQIRRVRHAHRLDRDTSGAVLYAKHEYAARSFDTLLRTGQVRRRYLAVVAGALPAAAGTIDLAIGRDRHVAGRYRVSPTGRPSRTNYVVMGVGQVNQRPVSLVECTLETGRTHQIRVHLSALGCPVVGDALYGAPQGGGGAQSTEERTSLMSHGHALHAAELRFWHPYEHGSVSQVAPLPPAFAALLDATGLTAAWEASDLSG